MFVFVVGLPSPGRVGVDVPHESRCFHAVVRDVGRKRQRNDVDVDFDGTQANSDCCRIAKDHRLICSQATVGFVHLNHVDVDVDVDCDCCFGV